MIKKKHFKSKEMQDSSEVEDIGEEDKAEVREEEVTLTEEKQIKGHANTAKKVGHEEEDC